MKKLKYILIVLIAVAGFTACSDDDDFHDSILESVPEAYSELDLWIREYYTIPYNINIMYKWKTFEGNSELNLVPVQEDKVIPFLDIVKRVWMEPYLELGGDQFFRENSPKQIMLIGSVGYQEDGTYVLGEAEQGYRISIFGLNTRPIDDMTILQYTHDFHHEFTHILHQREKYPPAFEEICAGDYTTGWTQISNMDALKKGFITAYAMADPNEDFAEMISYFVILTTDSWNLRFDALGVGTEAYNKLKEKETIILQYMKNNYNIDLYQLREKVQAVLARIYEENKG